MPGGPANTEIRLRSCVICMRAISWRAIEVETKRLLIAPLPLLEPFGDRHLTLAAGLRGGLAGPTGELGREALGKRVVIATKIDPCARPLRLDRSSPARHPKLYRDGIDAGRRLRQRGCMAGLCFLATAGFSRSFKPAGRVGRVRLEAHPAAMWDPRKRRNQNKSASLSDCAPPCACWYKCGYCARGCCSGR